jgi:hypothetical protein
MLLHLLTAAIGTFLPYRPRQSMSEVGGIVLQNDFAHPSAQD